MERPSHVEKKRGSAERFVHSTLRRQLDIALKMVQNTRICFFVCSAMKNENCGRERQSYSPFYLAHWVKLDLDCNRACSPLVLPLYTTVIRSEPHRTNAEGQPHTVLRRLRRSQGTMTSVQSKHCTIARPTLTRTGSKEVLVHTNSFSLSQTKRAHAQTQ